MGDIADGILNGDFDMYTGEYLGPGGGFPRTAQRRRQSVRERNNIKVRRFLKSQKILGKDYKDVCTQFLDVKGLRYKNNFSHITNRCGHHFDEFKDWVKLHASGNQE